MPEVYFTDTKSKAVFAADLSKPQFKMLVVGLEAGGQIPVHPGEEGAYTRIDLWIKRS